MRTPPPSTARDVPRQAVTYLELIIDGRTLLLPQGEVRSLEPVLDIEPERRLPGTVGWIAFEGTRWPVLCLSGALGVMDELPARRRVCALLSYQQRYFGIVCDAVASLEAGSLRLHPLPACMQEPRSALQALAMRAGEVGCVSTAARLAGLLRL